MSIPTDAELLDLLRRQTVLVDTPISAETWTVDKWTILRLLQVLTVRGDTMEAQIMALDRALQERASRMPSAE